MESLLNKFSCIVEEKLIWNGSAAQTKKKKKKN